MSRFELRKYIQSYRTITESRLAQTDSFGKRIYLETLSTNH